MQLFALVLTVADVAVVAEACLTYCAVYDVARNWYYGWMQD
jgi:hypothetical protein